MSKFIKDIKISEDCENMNAKNSPAKKEIFPLSLGNLQYQQNHFSSEYVKKDSHLTCKKNKKIFNMKKSPF